MDDTSRIDADTRNRIVALVQRELDARRIAISRELASIPPPVPACDVDFNRLLDDRGRIADELQHLRRLLERQADVSDIVALCRASTFLSDPIKAELHNQLHPTQGCNPGLGASTAGSVG